MVINYKKILSGIICSVMTANILAMSASPVSAKQEISEVMCMTITK